MKLGISNHGVIPVVIITLTFLPIPSTARYCISARPGVCPPRPEFAGGQATSTEPSRGQVEETLNFDTVDASKLREGVQASIYFREFRISISDQTPHTGVLIFNALLSMKDVTEAPSPPNILTQVYYGDERRMSFRLNFDEPLEAVRFTRPKIKAGISGILCPYWSATACDLQGKELSSVSEPYGGSWNDIPARVYSLRGPGIKSVVFLSDGRDENGVSRAGIGGVLIDDLTLVRGSR
jgi:hypothetical protein